MKTRGTALAGVLLTTITTIGLGVAAAPSAHAAREVVIDEAGDTTKNRLDLTRITLRNADHRVVARVRFARDVPGYLIVSVDPRRDTGVLLVAQKQRDGTVTSSVMAGSFGDGKDAAAPTCTDLRVRWSGAVARLALPSRCLHDGDYGALRFSVLTENGGHTDSDFAPDAPGHVTDWIARG